MTNPPLHIVLVDDHAIVRRGIRSYLESFPDLLIVGEAASAEEAIRRLPEWRADVVVLDLLLPGGMDGIEATRLFRALPAPPQVIILTAYTDDARVVAALRNGALGYIRKDARPEHLLQAVRTAARGEYYLDPESAAALGNPPEPGLDLSTREREVLLLVARGCTNREIAGELVISEETVKSHVASILSKLGLTSRAGAALVALRRGWLRVEEL
jgi:NarL family two-component system response regulator LiaR